MASLRLWVVCLAGLVPAAPAWAADWPTWRFDARRSGCSPQRLPDELHLQWVRALPAPRPASPNDAKLQFDRADRPVVGGRTLFVASSRTDTVTAVDTRSGQVRWTFFADGPVRLAPAGWNGRIYFACDDGALYCLDAASGTLRWRFGGSLGGRRVLGNGRLISAWPARGGCVLVERAAPGQPPAARVYFAAGIWPFAGTCVYGLDAVTGRVVWVNQAEKTGLRKVAPQGHLVVSGDKLIVPCGRSIPAIFDRANGRLLVSPFQVYRQTWPAAQARPRLGNSHAVAAAGQYLNDGTLFNLDTGLAAAAVLADGGKAPPLRPCSPVRDGILYSEYSGLLSAVDLRCVAVSSRELTYRTRTITRPVVKLSRRWSYRHRRPATKRRGKDPRGWPDVVSIVAGSRLYSARLDHLSALDISSKPPRLVWQTTLDGSVGSLAAADDRLFATTREGKLYCYGGPKVEPRHWPGPAEPPPAGAARTKLPAPLDAAEGYAVLLGSADGKRLESLCRASKAHWIAVHGDAEQVDRARRYLHRRGLYGARAHVLTDDPLKPNLPQYLADLIVLDPPAGGRAAPGQADLRRLYRSLRPYGGRLVLRLAAPDHDELARAVEAAGLERAAVSKAGPYTVVERRGPLPGAADWTHPEAGPANARISADQRVRPPFGLLWFGGSEDVAYFDRHLMGPRPLVAAGRMFVQGPNVMTAVDIYTGRVLWKRPLADLGRPYQGWLWQAGATALGPDFAAAPEAAYVLSGDRSRCLRLDAATGRPVGQFPLPGGWGTVVVWKDLLIAGAAPLDLRWAQDFKAEPFTGWPPRQKEALRKKVLGYVAAWKGFDRPPRRPGQTDVDDLLTCLNKVIAEASLLEKIPRPVRAKADAAKVKALVDEIGRLEKAGVRTVRQKATRKKLNRQLLRLFYPDLPPGPTTKGKVNTLLGGRRIWAGTASRRLVVMDRRSGRVLWARDAKTAFRHTAIAVGAGRIFCVDMWPRGLRLAGPAELLALDARSGRELWRRTDGVFGNWLGYAASDDVLIQGTGYSMFLSADLARKIVAHRGADGATLWEASASGHAGGPVSLAGHRLLPASGAVLDVRTGKPLTAKDPLTGAESTWTKPRLGGCGGPAVGGPHVLLSRSGSAGAGLPLSGGIAFYDLDRPLGLQHLDGFRPGCVATALCAGGLVISPNMGKHCECATSQVELAVALVHDAHAENWTYLRPARYRKLPKGIVRIGVNLAAPGDRIADDGTLWLAHPAPDAAAELEPGLAVTGKPRWFYRPSPRLAGGALKWVAGSGAEGLRSLKLTLGRKGSYNVRLHFAEPDELGPGQRVFSVAIGPTEVLKDFDIVRAAGGPLRGVVREFNGVTIDGDLTITFTAKAGRPVLCGLQAVLAE